MPNIVFTSHSSCVFPLPQILCVIKFNNQKNKNKNKPPKTTKAKHNSGVQDPQKHFQNIPSFSILDFSKNYFYLDILQLPEQLCHVVAEQGEEEQQSN